MIVSSFGIREFQLHMLATMPQSPQKAKALQELDAVEDDAKRALLAARGIGLFQPGHRVTVETAVLGDPPYEVYPLPHEVGHATGFADSRALAFHLPVFRDFDYVLNVTPGGVVWGQGMARSRDAPVPKIHSLSDLRPWRFVRAEVESAMSGPTIVEEFSFSESISGVVASGVFGEGERVIARFDFGLLQSVIMAG